MTKNIIEFEAEPITFEEWADWFNCHLNSAIKNLELLKQDLAYWVEKQKTVEATSEIEQSPELMASLDRAREDPGQWFSHHEVFGGKREGTDPGDNSDDFSQYSVLKTTA